MSRRAWICLGLIFAALFIWNAWYSEYDHYEIEHLHAAWLVATGNRPFADFLEQHHPTYWYLVAPLSTATSDPHRLVFVARLCNLVLLALMAVVVARILRRLYAQADWRWPLLL